MRALGMVSLLIVGCVQQDMDGNSRSETWDDPTLVTPHPPPFSLLLPSVVPGGLTTARIGGADPFANVAFVSSSAPGAGPCPPQLGGSCLGLQPPIALQQLTTANAQGEALVTFPTPGTAGDDLCVQGAAIQPGAPALVSDVVCETLPGAGAAFEIGDTVSSWTAPSYFRGNAFLNEQGGVLEAFDVYLTAPPGCPLDFYVLTRTSAAGDWVVEVLSERLAFGGTDWVSSGPIDLPLTPGTYYGVGVGWNCSATYYAGTPMMGQDYGVGTWQNNIWDNAYPGASWTYAVPEVGASDLAYYHVYYVN